MIFKSKSKQDSDRNVEEANRAKSAKRAGPTIITDDVVIEGKLITGGELQIDGTMHGDIRAASVVVDTQGSIHGEVVAEEIVVRGRIIGPLHAIHVHIFAGAHVEGDVTHETISIENGAFIEGNIRRAEDPVDVGSMPPLEDMSQDYLAADAMSSPDTIYGEDPLYDQDQESGIYAPGPDADSASQRPRLPGTDAAQ